MSTHAEEPLSCEETKGPNTPEALEEPEEVEIEYVEASVEATGEKMDVDFSDLERNIPEELDYSPVTQEEYAQDTADIDALLEEGYSAVPQQSNPSQGYWALQDSPDSPEGQAEPQKPCLWCGSDRHHLGDCEALGQYQVSRGKPRPNQILVGTGPTRNCRFCVRSGHSATQCRELRKRRPYKPTHRAPKASASQGIKPNLSRSPKDRSLSRNPRKTRGIHKGQPNQPQRGIRRPQGGARSRGVNQYATEHTPHLNAGSVHQRTPPMERKFQRQYTDLEQRTRLLEESFSRVSDVLSTISSIWTAGPLARHH